MKKGLLKFISVTAVAVMCASALAGCGNTNMVTVYPKLMNVKISNHP